MKQIIYNAIRTPDGVVLESHSVHEFKSHNGYFVDGGLSYLRRGYPDGGTAEELSEYLDPDDHEHNRQHIRWGSYGPDGDRPLRHIRLCDMDTQHIEIILAQFNLDGWRRAAYETELKYREAS